MNDSIPSKRRWCWRGSSDDFILRSEDMLAPIRSEDVLLGGGLDFILRSEDLLAPLRSEDFLLGGGLDALTSEDVVKDILLPDPAAMAAAAVAAKAGEKSKVPDREEKIGKLWAKLERNGTGDEPVPLNRSFRITSGNLIEDFETEARDLVAMHPSLFLGSHPSSFKGDAHEASTSSLPSKPRTNNYQEYSVRSKAVLLGGGLDARTSWDIVKDILLPDPAASVAAGVAAKAGEKSKAPDREEKIGKLRAKLERNRSSGSKPPSPLSSRDWIGDFEGESVDLDLDPSLFEAACRDAMAERLTAPPPPLSIPLASQLSCPSLKKPANAPSAASAAKTNAPPSASAATKKTKKKRRKRMLDETAVVEPNDGDVLSGRGAFTNAHPGNVRFRNEALRLRSWYRESSKKRKQEIAGILVDFVRNQGNRFLGKGKDGRWHEMIGNGPHYKASQALRERIRGGNDDLSGGCPPQLKQGTSPQG